MKILQVVSSLAAGFGGPSTAVWELCRELARQGEDVTIFTTDADTAGRMKPGLNMPIVLERMKVFYFPLQGMSNYKFSFPLAQALKDQAGLFDIIHIHALFQFSTSVAAYYCRRYKQPYIITPHGHLDPFNFRKKSWVKYAYLNLFDLGNLKNASAIHFTSEGERQSAISLGFNLPSVVIPLGINPEDFYQLPEYGSFRSKHPLLKNKKIILFLSRIHAKKGLDILTDAFGELIKEREDIYLVIAGPDSDNYSNKVKSWLARKSALSRVIFTGMLFGQDKLALFRDSDIFVLPSYSENFSLATVEAMACGLPVIVSDKVNIAAEISAAGAGLVVGTDYRQLVAALRRLLDEVQLRQELGSKARKLVKDKFTWEINTGALVKLYQSIALDS
ncbi:glycosyltransferase [bacterium]|nr:MAG: glycosyltransferase [bacterium]